MILRGDCLTCTKVTLCTETSVPRIIHSYTCPLFDPVTEPVYEARYQLMKQFGEEAAAKAIMAREVETDPEGEPEDASSYL